jgi:hypothetical protein
VYGVTLDEVGNPTKELASLQAVAHVPTARIVFDEGSNPLDYKGPINRFHPDAYIMGQIADSSYMPDYTVTSIAQWTQSLTQTLGSSVDVWEIGNEVNGNWLGTGTDTMAKIEAMYDGVSSQGGVTAITFFYEGEPSEPNNCIAADHGGNDMFTWIKTNFRTDLPPAQRPAETEKVRLGVSYALISWYPQQCKGETPNWPAVYTQLAAIFPNSKVGFGELGTANPQNGSTYEINEIKQYYPMAKTTQDLPASYVGGYFWWYFAEEMVPWGKNALSSALNQAIQ